MGLRFDTINPITSQNKVVLGCFLGEKEKDIQVQKEEDSILLLIRQVRYHLLDIF